MPLTSFIRSLFSSSSVTLLPFLHKPHHLLPSPKPSSLFLALSSSSGMESSQQSPSLLLVLGGKTSTETKFAQSLKNNYKNLKLPFEDSGVSVFLHTSEVEKKPYDVEQTFDMESYMNALSTDRFGRFLIWSPRLPSTQDLISQNFSELPVGSVCVADVQFKGRGRSKNVWESPRGCLLFSFTLQMDNGRIVPLLQYVVSLAVVEALKDVCDGNDNVLRADIRSPVLAIPFDFNELCALDAEASHADIGVVLSQQSCLGFPYLDIKIKWPNDLYLNGLKVGGILCTSTYSSKKFNVGAGIGLNVDNEKPTTCLNAELKQLTSAAYQLRREDILAAFFKRFEIFFDILSTQGFQALEEPYYKAWLHSGQRVVIQEQNEGQVQDDVSVTIQGLTPSGYLLAIGEDNQFYELHPDGNSFDFFNGLVRRKLE